ncbi:MAG: glycosyltransferase family 39 protein [Desulfosudaceae bacterium]
MSSYHRQHIETVLVFFSLTMLLVLSSRTFGLTWDESIYFQFSDSIRTWFLHDRSFDPETIAAYWSYSDYHNPHPPFMKILGAISSHWLGDALPYPTGYRLANILYVSACLAVACRLLAPRFSTPAALAAIAFAAFQPRVFGHLLIAGTDSPVAMSWLVLTLIAWRLQQAPPGSRRMVLRILLFFFLASASATKITGLLVVLPLAFYLLVHRNWREFAWLSGAAVFALLFVVAVWPPQWHHPLSGLAKYLWYPLTRSEMSISAVYLDKIHQFHLPWHYFLVMTAATVPVIIFICLVGLFFIQRRDHHGLLRALLFPVLFWLIIVHLPATPRHDGVRQFVSFYPLLGLLAWLGLLSLIHRLKPAFLFPSLLHPGRIIPGVAAIILFFQTATAHPYELSWYNVLMGGLPGAEKRGMEITYYLEAANQPFIRYIDPFLDNGATVQTHPPWPLLLQSYARHGLLTGNFSILSSEHAAPADYLLIFRRRGYVDDAFYKRLRPVAEVTCQGVSLVKFSRLKKESP